MKRLSTFDVLDRMASDDKDIRVGTDVLSAKRVKAGTQVTMGIAGDAVSGLLSQKYVYWLLIFDKEQYDETRAVMESEGRKRNEAIV